MNLMERAKFFKTKKRLGQNFLIDDEVIETIINYAQISKDDTVVEIGAGVGFVTEKLVQKAKKVIAIELDETAVAELRKINCGNLEIIHQDILKTDIFSLTDEKVKVIANIPYYITSPIIAHLLGETDDLNNKNRNAVYQIVLMVQEEVARRIVATEKSPAKQYGQLSILAQFWADCEIIRNVNRKSFYPAPNVNSSLVGIRINDKPRLNLTDYTLFRRVVKAAFSQRRKNIKNCLVNNGFRFEQVKSALKKIGIDENTRGEALSIVQFGQLSEEIKNEN